MNRFDEFAVGVETVKVGRLILEEADCQDLKTNFKLVVFCSFSTSSFIKISLEINNQIKPIKISFIKLSLFPL